MAATTQANIIPFDIAAQKRAAEQLTQGSNRASLELASRSLVVNDDESYRECMALRNTCATVEKRTLDFFSPMADAANKLHKMITAARSEMAGPWGQLKQAFGGKAEAYLLEQRKAERAAKEALDRAAQQERDRIAKEAEALMARGYVAQAIQKEQQASMMVAPTLPSAIPVVDNTRVGDNWKWAVNDMVAVCKAIGDGRVPLLWDVKGEMRPIVEISSVTVNAIVKRLQGSMDIPGISVTEGVRIGAARL